MKTLRHLTVSLLLALGLAFMPAMEASAAGGEQHRQSQTSHRSSSGNANSSRPGNSGNRPGNGNSRPGNGNTGNRPNNNSNRPGNGNSGNRPNNNGGKPGNNSSVSRPGTGANHGHNKPAANPVPKPNSGHGHANPAPRPAYNPPCINRWERPLPARPPRCHVSYRVPTIGDVLGLTFGSLINYGVNSLINAGYNVVGAVNDAIYMNNVVQFGYSWPEATMYYGANGLNGARFQYSSYSPGRSRFDAVYRNLVNMYGAPVSTNTLNGIVQSTWWGGNNTGYITLQYGPGAGQYGNTLYYTDLIYGN